MGTVSASDFNSTSLAVDNARAKWGLAKKNSQVSRGIITNDADYNNLVTWLTEAKSKSGTSTAIEAKVTAGEIMRVQKLTNLTSQANSVLNFCKCHGNCTGSCTGSCAGGCTGACGGNCTGSCRGKCGGSCSFSSESGH